MSNVNWKKEVFTIPNFLSLFRLLLIPVYMYLYLTAKNTASSPTIPPKIRRIT